MGAGGDAGLYLAEDMINGSTNHSDTFNNEILAGKQFFKIGGIEMWALV
jgi:hypothetical protein